MYDPWNLGGLNPSFFVIWGGLAPPSPYVEPPLVIGTGKVRGQVGLIPGAVQDSSKPGGRFSNDIAGAL